MILIQNITDILDKNGIKYFQGNDQNANIINLPYSGIKNKKNHIQIYLEILSSANLLRFTIIEHSNKNIETSELKSQLLDLNSYIDMGTFAMKNDSDTIIYKIDYILDKDGFNFFIYNFYITQCIKAYEILQEKEII